MTPEGPVFADARFMPGFRVGEFPGSPIYTGSGRDFETRIDTFDWNRETCEEEIGASVESAAALRDQPNTSWINVTGIHDAALVHKIGRAFGLHILSIEDILNPRHRAKVEYYPGYVYLVLKMAHAEPNRTARFEQISLVIGQGFVLTFQEDGKDVFDAIRHRLREGSGRIRSRSHDYLAYTLVDAVVDNYLAIIELVGAGVEETEDLLDEGRTVDLHATPAKLHSHKRELMALRKVVLPLREAMAEMAREDQDRNEGKNAPYLRDVQDHLIHIMDSIDIYREMIASLLGLHLALVGQKTNEEMRVLTVVATIFIPLTFIAGVYGMNFEYMPELGLRWAYPALLTTMALVAVGMLTYFRRRRWL